MLEVSLRKRRGTFRLDAAFAVPRAGVAALFGRSGCGKTTLADLVAGLLDPDEGAVRLDGEALVDTSAGRSVPAERRRIGYVFQDARLFPHLTIQGNLRYGLSRAPAGERVAVLDEVIELLGLRPLLGRRPHALSGGERQRVAIGRALLSQPRLLLMDEPLASLDAPRRDEVLPYLERLREACAMPIVYVSHQLEEVLRLATHLVLMEGGGVLAAGELSAMCLHPALRRIAGPEAVGAVLDGEIAGRDAATGLAELRVAGNVLRIAAEHAPGTRVRVRLPARDLILATGPVEGLSVRNVLEATVRSIEREDAQSELVHLEAGGAALVARVTRAAVTDLGLRPGLPVRVLVKAMSLRGQSCGAPGPAR